MSRYRLVPSPAQEAALRDHCGHARYVWNLAVEQHRHWRLGRKSAPGYLEQCRQLTAARAEHRWLAAGSQMVQQQALRDFAQAMANYLSGTHDRPSWRKAGRDEGFRVVAVRPGHVRRLSRRVGEVRVPKAGWVRFRWSRAVPPEVKSYRVTLDRAGRWHVAFAVIPEPIVGPGNGQTVGIDRGVAVSAALSTGEMLTVPGLSARRSKRLRCLQRRLARAKRGSNRRAGVKLRIANMTRSVRGTARDPGRNVRQKAGLNREILRSGWGLLVRRLEDKAPGRVEKIRPAFTSQRCSACGLVDAESRESQARFVCTACGFACHADVNAARNIAAGHVVTARGGDGITRPVNREPQQLRQSV
jgi:transposase